MKTILVMVMSLDGKTTKWGNSILSDWTSTEDKTYFYSLLEKQRVIVMGRKTFMAAQSVIKLSPKQLRIVITKSPENYESLSVPGQLEFTNNSPKVLLNKLEKRGYKQILLVGGAEINKLFLSATSVKELWLTVEPKIFGSGQNLTAPEHFNINLQLLSIKKLNPKGTLLLKYKVL